MSAAAGRAVPDLIASGLGILFCGINPGLYSGATGHHFARPGNRFWPAMYAGGFTPRLYSPFESSELLKLGYGITNMVSRATARADELSAEELVAGAKRLTRKVKKYKPRYVAIVGVTSYRVAFNRLNAKVGPQDHTIGDAHDLEREPVRHPGKTELQRSAQDVARENRADQRCEPSEQHQHEDRRHDDVGENDPHHAVAEADNQGEAKQQRRH
jgi:TDG/mug DNA glycosylase family protein